MCFPDTPSSPPKINSTDITNSQWSQYQQHCLLQSLTSGVKSSTAQEKGWVTNLYCRVVQFHSKAPLGWRAGPGRQKSPKLSPRLLQLSGNICFWSCRSVFQHSSPGCICHFSWQNWHLHNIFQFCQMSNFSDFLIKTKFKYCPSVVFSVDLYKQNDESMSGLVRDRLACISFSTSLTIIQGLFR